MCIQNVMMLVTVSHIIKFTTVTLIDNQTTLHMLWEEYIRGIGRNKPAKFFTAAERGRDKHRHSRRKNAWRVIENLVRTGLSSHEAIERIYVHYGPGCSVTTIINKLRRDGPISAIDPTKISLPTSSLQPDPLGPLLQQSLLFHSMPWSLGSLFQQFCLRSLN